MMRATTENANSIEDQNRTNCMHFSTAVEKEPKPEKSPGENNQHSCSNVAVNLQNCAFSSGRECQSKARLAHSPPTQSICASHSLRRVGISQFMSRNCKATNGLIHNYHLQHAIAFIFRLSLYLQ